MCIARTGWSASCVCALAAYPPDSKGVGWNISPQGTGIWMLSSLSVCVRWAIAASVFPLHTARMVRA